MLLPAMGYSKVKGVRRHLGDSGNGTGIYSNWYSSVSTLLTHLNFFILTKPKYSSEKLEEEIWGAVLMRQGHIRRLVSRDTLIKKIILVKTKSCCKNPKWRFKALSNCKHIGGHDLQYFRVH